MTLSAYAVADGNDVAEGSLTTLSPQPAMPDQIRYAELEFYGSLDAEFNGNASFELVWNDGISTSERNGILSAFGLSDTVASNDVTLNHRLNADTWQRSNCKAVNLQADSRRPYGKQNLRILVLNPTEAS